MNSESDSTSESSSDSEDENIAPRREAANEDVDIDEDEETGPVVTSSSQVRTKNELVELNILIPQISEVGPDEILEKVGEVLNIVDGRVVIVKGIPSGFTNRGSEKALDVDTLLVLEDRAVLGFVGILLLIHPECAETLLDLRDIRTHERTPLPGVVQ